MREQRGMFVVCALAISFAFFGLDACGSFNEPAQAFAPDGAPLNPGAGGAGPQGRGGRGGAAGSGVFSGSGGCPGYTCFDCATGTAVPATCETGRVCPEGYGLDCGPGGTRPLGTGGISGRGRSTGSAGRGGTTGAGVDSGSGSSMGRGGSAGTSGSSGAGGTSGTGGDDSGAQDSSAGRGADDAGGG